MLEEIKPCKVMRYFEEISKIPRKSGKEDKIVEYIKKFAIERKLEYYTDNYRNIIIKKNATPGKENSPAIALQAHTDMICEKLPESNHDFSKDGLELYVDGDFIKARGTTLGADNGIGVAIILAVLDCEKIKAPKLECIFTSEEETTMLGAINLDLANIESNRIISLDNGKEGKILISSAECNEWKGKVNFTREKTAKPGFELVYDNFKEKYYKEAYRNFRPNNEYYEFIILQEIHEYAEFMSQKTGNEKDYYLFLQYILYKQWMELKYYANSKNVQIIGDMPVYPVFESVETKYHSEYFEMENGKFTFEAGTPPDYFNENGQKWNSPVYNVESIKKDNYQYLVKRFKYHLKLFDKVRIDYFRGYDSFFRIPFGKTGKEGTYVDGLSYGFFDELFKEKNVNIENFIIEDLGEIREETIKLREHYGFTRQKILQFTIDLDNLYDRDNEAENVLVFPGNHDCNTIYGWYKTLDDEHKWKLKEFLRKNECYDININIGIMQYLSKCKAKMPIIMVQDILGLDENSRINVPGVESNQNWSWKLINFDDLKERIKDY